MKVGVAILGSPSLIVLDAVSVDVKQLQTLDVALFGYLSSLPVRIQQGKS